MRNYDVAIIGAGVTGCAIARQLGRSRLAVALIDRAEDVAMGASRANSAIVHAGYDCPPGSLEAKLNVEGNALFTEWCRDLDVPLKRVGTLVVAFNAEEEATLEELYARGLKNGVPGMRLISGDEARRLEPMLAEGVTKALLAETGGITCPYELTIACAENARANGAEWLLGRGVTGIERTEAGFVLDLAGEKIAAKRIVNAAGVFADDIARMIGDDSFTIHPRKGEYVLLDRSEKRPEMVIFPTPTKMGKGILVSPTVDGNAFAGPTAVDMEDKTDTSVTPEGIEKLTTLARKTTPALNLRAVITSFAGIRAQPSTGDFIIRPSEADPRFIHAAGICSPGLTSAPAIARMVEGLLGESGLTLEPRPDYQPRRAHMPAFRHMTDEERVAAIAENRLYGRVICRCETITEAEIVEAVRRGARTVDGVKRRTRAGMGRCQGGFCSPRVMEIISREAGIPMEELTKFGGNSRMVAGRTRGGGGESMNLKYDVAVIGGGPAGLAAALEARKASPEAKILILERDKALGGILQQCIHNGFGLHFFGEELTGPEYAQRFIDRLEGTGIEVWTDTMVLAVSPERAITCVSAERGLVCVEAGAVVLAMGCRERTRGALNIPGTRPAGVYTAGCAQRLNNMEGYLPGKRVVILGSGDIGLIMARRMTWEGAKVELVAEIMSYSSGLNRNIVQCLVDNDIPLKFNHTVTKIHGKERVEGVTVSEVDPATRQPIPGTEEFYACDTLLLSVGLLPENELTRAAGIEMDPVTSGARVDERRQTSLPGVFACGNVLHVHDLVDNVSAEAMIAGRAAAEFALGRVSGGESYAVRAENGVRYALPQRVSRAATGKLDVYFRVGAAYRGATLEVQSGDEVIFSRKKQIMTPGEMEKVTIDAEKLTGDVTVRLKQA